MRVWKLILLGMVQTAYYRNAFRFTQAAFNPQGSGDNFREPAADRDRRSGGPLQILTNLQRYGPRGWARCLEDAEFHLEFLLSALDAE